VIAVVQLPACRFGEAEVEQLGRALGRDLDVGRFQVVLDNTFFVRGFRGDGDLAGVGPATLFLSLRSSRLCEKPKNGSPLNGRGPKKNISRKGAKIAKKKCMAGFVLTPVKLGELACQQGNHQPPMNADKRVLIL
jgi:hypothetical protein